MNMFEIKIPDIGDFKAVEVIELLVKSGDSVQADQSIMTVESDKASMEIPSSRAGVVREWKVKIGDQVAEGSTVLLMEAVGNDAPATSSPASASSLASASASASPPAPAPVPASASPQLVESPPQVEVARAAVSVDTASSSQAALGRRAHASPSIRKFARELGVDLTKVPGTGPNNRITREDVHNCVKQAMAVPVRVPETPGNIALLPWPSLDFSKFGATELQPLPRIKKISGPNLHRNWVMIPHVTQFENADVTELEALRVQLNASNKVATKLTILAFVAKAAVAALKQYPAFNSSLDQKGENLILKKYYNIGFAADTPNGLVVPVVKGADAKSVTQIAEEMSVLSAQAREGKLKPADMQGATFTISSLGGIVGTPFTPIVNAPEVAILGLSKASMKPVWDGKTFQPRLIMPLSLSYDHRVIDGALGARFAVYLSDVLADMRKILL